MRENMILNSAQQEAVTHGAGPLLIVAGAGTGKTAVLTARIAHLIKTGQAKPHEIVALTFTEAAADEMQERINALLGSYTDVVAGTFHAFCQTTLHRYGHEIGLPAPFHVFGPSDCWRLVRRNFEQFNLSYYRPRANPAQYISALISHFNRCKDELISAQSYAKYAEELRANTDTAEYARKKAAPEPTAELLELARISELSDAYHVYTRLMLSARALDFGDLLLYTHELLTQRPNITSRLRAQYKFVMVDEFQDTNTAQYAVVKMLAGPAQNLCVVGDDDQSIYAWRGASVRNILRFMDDQKTARVVTLTRNYRSAQDILDAAHRLSAHNNPYRLEHTLKIDKKLRAEMPREGEVLVLVADSHEQEIAEVTRRISEYCRGGESCAILARAHSHLVPFAQALRACGIPVSYEAAPGILRTRSALDCIAILRVLHSFADENALSRLLTLAPFAFTSKDRSASWEYGRKHAGSGWDRIVEAGEGITGLSQDGVRKASSLIKLLRKLSEQTAHTPAGVLLLSFLEESGLLASVAARAQRGIFSAADYLLELHAFFSMLPADTAEHSTLEALLEYLDDLRESGEEHRKTDLGQTTANAVQIMSVHGAKGMEFDRVFVVNMIEQRFPTRERKAEIPLPEGLLDAHESEADNHLAQERRLLYVALTRARRSAILTAAQHYGSERARKLSRFIDELELSDERTIKIARVGAPALPHAEASRKMQTTSAAPAPDHYSFSQLKMYLNCPLQYRFAQVHRIPTRQSGPAVFGKTMHTTLQVFYERLIERNEASQDNLFSSQAEKQVRTPPLTELLGIYENVWSDFWFYDKEQRGRYFEEGKKMLQLFYQRQQEAGWRVPAALEHPFSFTMAGRTMRGRIDRIDREPDGSISVVDYKTGKPKDKLERADKEQLFLYQIACREYAPLQNLGRVSSLAYYYFEDGSVKRFLGSDKDLDAYREKILATMNDIEQGNFEPRPNPVMCGMCPFRDICEYRQ